MKTEHLVLPIMAAMLGVGAIAVSGSVESGRWIIFGSGIVLALPGLGGLLRIILRRT